MDEFVKRIRPALLKVLKEAIFGVIDPKGYGGRPGLIIDHLKDLP